MKEKKKQEVPGLVSLRDLLSGEYKRKRDEEREKVKVRRAKRLRKMELEKLKKVDE